MFNSALLRLLVSGIYLATTLSSCFQYKMAPDTLVLEEKAKLYRSDQDAFCRFVSEPSHKSAFFYYSAAQCLLPNERDSKNPSSARLGLLKNAAVCGSAEAKQTLINYGEKGAHSIFILKPGSSGYMLFNGNTSTCGMEQEITTTGWIIFPIGVPLYVVSIGIIGGALVVASAVGLIVYIVAGPIVYFTNLD